MGLYRPTVRPAVNRWAKGKRMLKHPGETRRGLRAEPGHLCPGGMNGMPIKLSNTSLPGNCSAFSGQSIGLFAPAKKQQKTLKNASFHPIFSPFLEERFFQEMPKNR